MEDKRYITAANSPDFYWPFTQERWDGLQEEGYGPILCSKEEVIRWEADSAKFDGREPRPWSELIIEG